MFVVFVIVECDDDDAATAEDAATVEDDLFAYVFVLVFVFVVVVFVIVVCDDDDAAIAEERSKPFGILPPTRCADCDEFLILLLFKPLPTLDTIAVAFAEGNKS